MITFKTAEDIKILREGGRRHAEILKAVGEKVRAGISAKELEETALILIKQGGDTPAFLGYKPYGAKRPYPAALCVSINDEIVHGIPNEEEKILKEGDIVSLDLGLIHDELITDMAVTIGVGEVDEAGKRLMNVTREALHIGIDAAIGGGYVGDIGEAIENYIAPMGFGIVRELAGHGVGYKVHEDPYVPNFKGAKGDKLEPGMVIAIEPMVNEGTAKVKLMKDGYTYKTADGKRSAHFEHTVLITTGKAEILTQN